MEIFLGVVSVFLTFVVLYCLIFSFICVAYWIYGNIWGFIE